VQKVAKQAGADGSIRGDAIITLNIESEAISSRGKSQFHIIVANKDGAEARCLEVYSHGRWTFAPIITFH